MPLAPVFFGGGRSALKPEKAPGPAVVRARFMGETASVSVVAIASESLEGVGRLTMILLGSERSMSLAIGVRLGRARNAGDGFGGGADGVGILGGGGSLEEVLGLESESESESE